MSFSGMDLATYIQKGSELQWKGEAGFTHHAQSGSLAVCKLQSYYFILSGLNLGATI